MRMAILVVSLLCASCGAKDTQPSSSSHGSANAASQGTQHVEVVRVVAERLSTSTRLPAEIYAYESVALFPRVSAFVEEMLVDRGDRVKKGQLLVRLSAPELVAQRAESQSKLAGARSTFERMRAASTTPGAIAKHDLELAEAALKAEEARLAALQTLEGYLAVRAPFDGMITARNVHPGALVGPPSAANSTAMLAMESIGHLRVTVAVPELDVGAIAEGAMADFRVRAWPGKTFSAPIRRIAHAVDPKTRTMAVELDYINESEELAPGMFADVIWPIRRDAESLLVPESAVLQTPDDTYVERVEHGTIELVSVERGVSVDERVEVFARDLAAGDLIVKRGSEQIRAGTRVEARVVQLDGGHEQ